MEFRQASNAEILGAMRGGQKLPLLRLALSMVGCATEGEMNGNFKATLERGYTPFNDVLLKYSGTASLVGSGPSIKETYKELKGDVCAVNQAIGWLLDHGVVPKWAMLWDADEVVAKFAVPHPEITYLVASRCHPAVFERLKDCKVLVWHAGGDHNINELMRSPEVVAKMDVEEPLINGGSAGITRGIYVVNSLGYRDIHIFGGDSSYSADGQTHVRGSLVPEKDVLISIGNDPPKWFRTTPEWCAQVEEYRSIYALFTAHDHTNLTVYGEGTMLKEMHDRISALKASRPHAEFMEQMGIQEMERQKLSEMATNQLSQPLEEAA